MDALKLIEEYNKLREPIIKVWNLYCGLYGDPKKMIHNVLGFSFDTLEDRILLSKDGEFIGGLGLRWLDSDFREGAIQTLIELKDPKNPSANQLAYEIKSIEEDIKRLREEASWLLDFGVSLERFNREYGKKNERLHKQINEEDHKLTDKLRKKIEEKEDLERYLESVVKSNEISLAELTEYKNMHESLKELKIENS